MRDSLKNTLITFWRHGMSTVVITRPQPTSIGYEEPRFEYVVVTEDRITAYLSDQRTVSVPLWWSWRLDQATQEQRRHYEIIGAGRTVHWPDIDEHLSVQSFFTGTPTPRGASS